MGNKNFKRVNLYDREIKNRNKNINYINKDAEVMINKFRENIDRIKKRFEIVDMFYNKEMYEEAHDVLRFQIVYVMSALDFFMHELYSYGLIKIFRNEMPKTYRYNEYKVPMKLLEKALNDAENIDKYLKEEFIELNSGYTFMSPGRIRELLNIISHEDEFAEVEKALKFNNIIKDNVRLDSILEQIYLRRNKISHQTDINHGSDNKNSINHEEVEFYIEVISNLVEELYKIICL